MQMLMFSQVCKWRKLCWLIWSTNLLSSLARRPLFSYSCFSSLISLVTAAWPWPFSSLSFRDCAACLMVNFQRENNCFICLLFFLTSPMTNRIRFFLIDLFSSGLVVSTLCDEETSAIHLSLGSFYPNLLLSGVLWPMEGMPVYLRYVSYFLPQTYAVESLRNVFGRGWGIERPEVYFGIVISFSWIFALLALSLIVVRIRKYTG